MNTIKVASCFLIASTAASSAASLEEVSVEGSFGYVTKYVTSGAQAAEDSFQPEVVLGYENWSAGVWANLAVENRDNYGDEYNFFIAYAHPLSEKLEASAGLTYYYFPQDYAVPSRTRELNLGLAADYPGAPALYFNYDLDLEQSEIGIEAGHAWEIADGWTFELGAAIGYLHADDADSDQVPGSPSDGYAYAEAAANLVYTINDSLALTAGPRFAINNNGDGNMNGDEDDFWFGAMLTWSH